MYSSYETIHYHDSTYYASLGPFALDIQTPKIITSLATNRLVQSHDSSLKTITTNSGTSLNPGDRISVDGRIYTVDGDTGTVITVFETPPNEITVDSAVMTGGIGDGMNGVTGKDNAGNAYRLQGGTSAYDQPDMNIQLYNYWPCGSRGGPTVSRLDGFGYVSAGWMLPTSYAVNNAYPVWHDDGDDGSYDATSGVDYDNYENTLSAWSSYTSGDMPNTRPRPFGYRFGLRQPYNKPRWAWYGMRAYIEQGISSSFVSVDYKHGPLIEGRHRSNTWVYAGGESSPSGADDTFETTYVGILERQTNFAGMENMLPNNILNTYGRVTRYSDGMRMTRPFGCPVRTLRNNSDLSNNTETNLTLKPHIRREWLGDHYGHGILDVALASQYYLIDWWGNTRGEDVRRMPVRGFGVSPAWSPKEGITEQEGGRAGLNEFIHGGLLNPYNPFYMGHSFYNFKKIISPHLGDGQGATVEYQLMTNLTGISWFTSPYDTIPSQVGNYNAINSGIQNEIVDFFFPVTARRVGDEGGGRGNRYPTTFNREVFADLDILDELPFEVEEGTVPKTKGAVLSYNTAEPNIGDGYIRPKNTPLSTDEVPRGISARLLIDDYGLLKAEATLSARQLGSFDNSITQFITTPYSDIISRSSPKIGLDVENFEGIDNNAMIVNTEAHSLHTNRQVGQRGILQNAMTNLGPSNLILGGYLTGAVSHIYNNTSMFKNIGGTNILNLKNYSAPIELGAWGTRVDGAVISSPQKSPNPYVTPTYNTNTNKTEKEISLMLRPIKKNSKEAIQYFSFNILHSGSPQYIGFTSTRDYNHATVGGKYGIFAYDMPNARASAGFYLRATNPDTNPPYAPIYDNSNLYNELTLKGHLSGIVDISTNGIAFTSTHLGVPSINNDIGRVVITENTLQHYRADASRKKTINEDGTKITRKDYTVQPRFSQSLHPRGHKEDVLFNEGEHSIDGDLTAVEARSARLAEGLPANPRPERPPERPEEPEKPTIPEEPEEPEKPTKPEEPEEPEEPEKPTKPTKPEEPEEPEEPEKPIKPKPEEPDVVELPP